MGAAPGSGVARRGRKPRKGSSAGATDYHGPVRRLIGWTAGVVGIAALARMLARRRRAPLPVAAPPVDDHAEALRRKLDESRAAETTSTATPAEPADEASRESLEDRRARVHAKAQEAIDAMQEPLE